MARSLVTTWTKVIRMMVSSVVMMMRTTVKMEMRKNMLVARSRRTGPM